MITSLSNNCLYKHFSEYKYFSKELRYLGRDIFLSKEIKLIPTTYL